MAIKRMPIGQFMTEVRAALNRKDGYIMGAKGQNPRTWKLSSWFLIQYKDRKQYTEANEKKALYWREHAARVWDCNGLAEGIYEDWSGVNINTKARYNYAQWCSVKGTGMIPASQRREGAAVFWGNNAASIHHVAYLDKPVDALKPTGDWYIIEARGVMYGVVRTRLSQRKPNYWGLMTKYFDYADSEIDYAEPTLGERILRNGMEGSDVKAMQNALISLGYDCGKWGADGDFGDASEIALKAFQAAHGCDADGEYGPITHAAMLKALEAAQKPAEAPRTVSIVGGNCYIRSAPNTSGNILGVAHDGDKLSYGGQTSDNGWNLIDYKNQNGWVSGKYSKLEG